MPQFRMYATVCENPDCLSDETLLDYEIPIDGACVCDCGAPARRIPNGLVPSGIMVEYHDIQTGRTFRSNREYNEYLKYGKPKFNAEGEQVGFTPIREFSSEEMDRAELQAKEREHRNAAKNGMTWAQYKAATTNTPESRWHKEA